MQYGYTQQIDMSFDDAVEAIRSALQEEGFGVLTEIDIAATLKKKLDVDYNSYVILGACHPSSALEVLQVEQEIGLLLPCNVIVYDNGDGIFVSAIKATAAMSIVGNADLEEYARDIEEKLCRAVDSAVVA